MTDSWSPILHTSDWYLSVIPELEAFVGTIEHESSPVRDLCKGVLYDFFERHLIAGDFCLGNTEGIFDRERGTVDTVVIHHTGNPEGMSPDRLSAIELMRLYAPYFAQSTAENAELRGMPVCSRHVRDGKQVFWPYHWLIRDDGAAVRLLSDRETGWHAGNWKVNCRSIAIALDNDFELSEPSECILEATARLIATNYPAVPLERVLGHSEITGKTTCPSAFFLSTLNRQGWKPRLLESLERIHNDSRHYHRPLS